MVNIFKCLKSSLPSKSLSKTVDGITETSLSTSSLKYLVNPFECAIAWFSTIGSPIRPNILSISPNDFDNSFLSKTNFNVHFLPSASLDWLFCAIVMLSPNLLLSGIKNNFPSFSSTCPTTISFFLSITRLMNGNFLPFSK